MSRPELQRIAKNLGLPATGPTDRLVRLVAAFRRDPASWSFSDFLLILPHLSVHQGGHTLGFWSNKNGQDRMNDGGEMATELGLLSTLNLVGASGTAFDPLNYDGFRAWLLGGNSVNMAYMLSVQLAAMTLNVEAGFVDGDAYFLPCKCTINELMDDANASLGLYPNTPSGHSQRDEQATLKTWLDQLNNGANIIPVTPCTRTFY